VYYTFNSLMLLQEPMLVTIAFMVLFLTVIIFVRLDFSISVVSYLTLTSVPLLLLSSLFLFLTPPFPLLSPPRL